jgi:hypothetical protein
VLNDLAVDVQHQCGQRELGERAIGRAARPGRAILAEPRTPFIQAA